MALPKEDIYTIEDIYALPDGERAELIDGQIYYMAPPSRKHQKLSGEIFGIIREYIRSNHGACEVYAAPFAVYLDEHTNTYVEPDISVICDPKKNWMTEVVPEHRIGSLKSYHHPANKWTIIRNYSNTVQPVLENIGLSTLTKILFWSITLNREHQNNIHCQTK